MARTLSSETKKNMTYVDLLQALKPILLAILNGKLTADDFKLTIVTENGFLTAGNFTPKQKSSSSPDDVLDDPTTKDNNTGTSSEILFRHNSSKHTRDEDASLVDPPPDPFLKRKKKTTDRVDISQIPAFVYVLFSICEVFQGIPDLCDKIVEIRFYVYILVVKVLVPSSAIVSLGHASVESSLASDAVRYDKGTDKSTKDETANLLAEKGPGGKSLEHAGSTDKHPDGATKQHLATERIEVDDHPGEPPNQAATETKNEQFSKNGHSDREGLETVPLESVPTDGQPADQPSTEKEASKWTYPKVLNKISQQVKWTWTSEQFHSACQHIKKVNNSRGSFKTIYRQLLLFGVLICVFGQPADATSVEHLTLIAGERGVIPFRYDWSTESSSAISQTRPPYHTIGYDHIDQPFYRGGRLYPEGLKDVDQEERFIFTTPDNGGSNQLESLLNVILDPVKIEDAGTFVLTVLSTDPDTDLPPISRKVNVSVIVPSGKANCFFAPSNYKKHTHYAVCSAKVGSGDTTISCFQNGRKVPYVENSREVHDEFVRKFWVTFTVPLSCCSHEMGDVVTEESCDHFRYPPPTERPETTKQSTASGQEEEHPVGHIDPTQNGAAGRMRGSYLAVFVTAVMSVIVRELVVFSLF